MSELRIAGINIEKGQRKRVVLPVARLFDHTGMHISAEVIRGKEDGPTMFVSAAIHGDELIGVEIVKRLLEKKKIQEIKGTLIVIPIVNPFGYNTNSRYLPDRRDLNRSFPGSSEGSMAARVAHTFLNEIVYKCHYGIDIHSGAIHRENYPQIRLGFDDPEEMKLAQVFGAPVIINSPLREGTLRQAAHDKGIKTLLYEAGEALRVDDHCVVVAIAGILNVMEEIGMLAKDEDNFHSNTMMVAKTSFWMRAPVSGSLRALKKLGAFVQPGDILGVITGPFGDDKTNIVAHKAGIIIGGVTMPLVNRGNALFHIATLEDMKVVDDKDIIFDKDIDIENEDYFRRTP
ncbi:MAG: succinylglutamate desuccinylase/aspartoacylase family protein [Gammaproteobacteria bacterium]